MKHAVLIILLLWAALPITAQSDCGEGLPCGAIPWALPVWPDLSSPSPFPTIEFTVTYTPSPTYTPSHTPDVPPTDYPTFNAPTAVPSPTPWMNTTEMVDQVGTLTAMLSATPVTISGAGDIDTTVDSLAGDSGSMFGYIQGLTLANFGVLSPLLTFLMTAFSLTMLIKFMKLILPMVVLVFGFLRKIIQFILDFIPG